MNLIDRIQMHILLNRADNVIRNAKRAKAERDHLNRPHVQSNHMISHPIAKQQPVRDHGDYGIGPMYAICAAVLIALVVYVNVFHQDAGTMYACTTLAAR